MMTESIVLMGIFGFFVLFMVIKNYQIDKDHEKRMAEIDECLSYIRDVADRRDKMHLVRKKHDTEGQKYDTAEGPVLERAK